MRTLVFSDTHFGARFEEKKFRLLENLINQADRVIINGDFWDGFFITFSQFVNSPHKHLFPILKKKDTVYLTGNHDSPELLDSRTEFFSNLQTNHYELSIKDKRLIFEHGHERVPIFGKLHFLPKKPIAHTLNALEYVIVNSFSNHFSHYFQNKFNKTIKKNISPFLKENDIFICGHTHLAEFNMAEQFINTGFIKHGLAQYLIIEDDKIIPKEEWYD